MKRMRVLHLVKTSKGARWAARLMTTHAQHGLDVHVAVPEDGPMVSLCEREGVSVHAVDASFPARRPWRFPGIARSLRRLVERIQPDVVHSHFVSTTLAARLALGERYGIPRVFQVPGPLHLEHALFRTGEIATATRSDYWIATCKDTQRRYLRAGVPPARVFLCYYGRRCDPSLPGARGKLRRELGLAPEARVVGMVAYMYAPKRYLGQRRGIKGHEDLIDAIAIANREGADLWGVFVGGAWGAAHAYEARVRAYGEAKCGRRAIFLGTRSDVTEIYPDFDVVVHPSHSENLGGAGESLSLGVPTIATDVGGFPDIVQHGVTGILVPPRDPERLARAIVETFVDWDRTRRMSHNGRALAASLLDIERTSREVVAVYETALRRTNDAWLDLPGHGSETPGDREVVAT